jgi:hypothetical protein
MDITLEALALLIVLLPGFVSSSILDHVAVRKPKDHFGRIIEALVFTFIIYAVVVGAVGIPAFELPAGAADVPRIATALINQSFVWVALVLSILLPLFLGFLSTTDGHMRFLRLIRVTNKTARETTWLDVFADQKRYVIVNLTGERRVFGWPQYFSNDRDEGLLYLFDPAWVNADGTYTNLDIHGLFLVEPDSIESIEFTHVTDRNARISKELQGDPANEPRPEQTAAHSAADVTREEGKERV